MTYRNKHYTVIRIHTNTEIIIYTTPIISVLYNSVVQNFALDVKLLLPKTIIRLLEHLYKKYCIKNNNILNT